MGDFERRLSAVEKRLASRRRARWVSASAVVALFVGAVGVVQFAGEPRAEAVTQTFSAVGTTNFVVSDAVALLNVTALGA